MPLIKKLAPVGLKLRLLIPSVPGDGTAQSVGASVLPLPLLDVPVEAAPNADMILMFNGWLCVCCG